jgi:hypothetical protein
MNLRGNLRVLIEKLRFLKKPQFISKLRLLMKPGAFSPLILFGALLLFAAIFALTQESPDGIGREGSVPDEYDDLAFGLSGDEEPYDQWIPPGPPRWFRSNAGGMTLEETRSRLAAFRYQYALVIDYVSPHEIDSRLLPYYKDDYSVEIRILYEEGVESRRQWLFHDASGITRVNAVFKRIPDISPDEEFTEDVPTDETLDDDDLPIGELAGDQESDLLGGSPELAAHDADDETGDETDALAEGDPALAATDEAGFVALPLPLAKDAMPDMDTHYVAALISETAVSLGFIELYNATAQIIEDRWLFDDDSVIMILYSYNGNMMLKAETRKMPSGSEFKAMYTDYYRYNRSYSLRHIERAYHEGLVTEPIRLTFPGRVLEAAADDKFIGEKLSVVTEFMGDFSADEGFRVIYDTDNRGRVLSQTMIDNSNEIVWILKNTWIGDRIVSSLKTEGDDAKLTEYEYDEGGDRIVQRDIHNGVLERVVYTRGTNETEELYMNGVLVLRAYWEDGRKISEERVRRR